MDTFTSETMAVADVYAEAVLGVAKDQGQREELRNAVLDLMSYMDQHPEFVRFLTSATIDKDTRRESLEKLFRGKMNDLLLNLLQVLNDRNRSSLIHAVVRAGQLRIQKEQNRQEVLIDTAAPLPEDLKTRLKDAISLRIGKEALLIEQLKPELIGGIVIHVGDHRLDASLLTQIRFLQRKLASRAEQAFRNGHDTFIIES